MRVYSLNIIRKKKTLIRFRTYQAPCSIPHQLFLELSIGQGLRLCVLSFSFNLTICSAMATPKVTLSLCKGLRLCVFFIQLDNLFCNAYKNTLGTFPRSIQFFSEIFQFIPDILCSIKTTLTGSDIPLWSVQTHLFLMSNVFMFQISSFALKEYKINQHFEQCEVQRLEIFS